MSSGNKIQYYDLRLESISERLPKLLGRNEEQERLTRIISRHLNNNAFVVGHAGSGKTTFLRGWANGRIQTGEHQGLTFLEFNPDSFADITTPNAFARLVESFGRLPTSVVIIDNFGELIYGKPQLLQSLFRMLKPVFENSRIQIILAATPQEYAWIEHENSAFLAYLEKVDLKEQPQDQQVKILEHALETFKKRNPVLANPESLKSIVEMVVRFPRLGQLPKAAISVLDEAMALARLEKTAVLTQEHVHTVVASKAGIPLSQLVVSETEKLKQLEPMLNAGVIGQTSAVKTISSIITRAKLGLKNPRRPLGSFLVLGPSGVGKTETAKLLAELVYGKKESFLRLDMSEFGESHTTQRLLGAPAGYVGFEAGGGLTSPIKQEPYSLVLLDEVEKAHPKIFDIFLQVLDDGRLTSGAGETVDFTQTIIMATSNIGVDAILQSTNPSEVSSPEFIKQHLVPELAKFFRLEFINRFDAIIVFNPLSREALLDIAKLEIKKIEKRAEKFGIAFDLDMDALSEEMERFTDPRFGARPLKRYIEETCENLIAEALLQNETTV